MPLPEGFRNIPMRPKLVDMLAKRWNRHKTRIEGAHHQFGGFANDLLEQMLRKYEWIDKYMPDYEYIGANQSALMIKDAKLDKTVYIRMKDYKLHCDYDNSENCAHVLFAVALPEVTRLALAEPEKQDGKGEDVSDGSTVRATAMFINLLPIFASSVFFIVRWCMHLMPQ
jgi:hypothetical protein